MKTARWIKRTKELMGSGRLDLLRCDDCVTYHVRQCREWRDPRTFMDAFNVALVVADRSRLPHLRRAIEKLIDTLTGNFAECFLGETNQRLRARK